MARDEIPSCSSCGATFPDSGEGFSDCASHREWEREYDEWIRERQQRQEEAA